MEIREYVFKLCYVKNVKNVELATQYSVYSMIKSFFAMFFILILNILVGPKVFSQEVLPYASVVILLVASLLSYLWGKKKMNGFFSLMVPTGDQFREEASSIAAEIDSLNQMIAEFYKKLLMREKTLNSFMKKLLKHNG